RSSALATFADSGRHPPGEIVITGYRRHLPGDFVDERVEMVVVHRGHRCIRSLISRRASDTRHLIVPVFDFSIAAISSYEYSPRNDFNRRYASRNASCATSSASAADPTADIAARRTACWWRRTSSSNAA